MAPLANSAGHPNIYRAVHRANETHEHRTVQLGQRVYTTTHRATETPEQRERLTRRREYRSSWIRENRDLIAERQRAFRAAIAAAESPEDHVLLFGARAAHYNPQPGEDAFSELPITRSVRHNEPAQIAPLTREQILSNPRALYFTRAEELFTLHVHPLILERSPEKVLNELACYLKDHDKMPDVDFLTDSLTEGMGVDGGGLRTQLLSQLFRYLFDGKDSRTIKMKDGIPVKNENNAIFTNLGITLARCFQHSLVTGRVCEPSFFQCLLEVLELPIGAHLTDQQIIFASACLMPKETLKYLGTITQDETIQLAAIYRPSIEAVQAIACGMAQIIDINQLRDLPAAEIDHRIQGRLDRNLIASLISYVRVSPVVTQWSAPYKNGPLTCPFLFSDKLSWREHF